MTVPRSSSVMVLLAMIRLPTSLSRIPRASKSGSLCRFAAAPTKRTMEFYRAWGRVGSVTARWLCESGR
jgi:hypothetical protein